MNNFDNILFKESDINSLYFFKNMASVINVLYIQFLERNFNMYRRESLDAENNRKGMNIIDVEYLFTIVKNIIVDIDKEISSTNYGEENKRNFTSLIYWTTTEISEITEKINKLKYFQEEAFITFINVFYQLFKKFTPFLNFTIVDKPRFNEFLKLKDEFGSPQDALLSNYLSDRLNNRLIIFENKLNDLESKSTINSELFNKMSNDFFVEQKLVFDKSVFETINLFRQELDTIYSEYSNELVLKVANLKNSVDNSKNEVDNLDNAVQSYKSAVSTKIQNEISKHYQKKATMEMRTYWGATTFSILLILGSLGLLAWGLIDYYYDYISTSSCLSNEDFKSCVTRLETIRDITKNIGISFFIMRFVFSLLLFLTVIYTSRIASRAYSHWRHSENMHLKLSSLEPFITELPKEVRHEIHRDLIPDYFGKDAGLVDTANEKFKDLPANVSAVAMKAIEQISGGGSNSSTEKNNKKPESETG